MNLDQKIERFETLIPNHGQYTKACKEIKISNDGLYLFYCKKYLGMPEQIVSDSSGKLRIEIVSKTKMVWKIKVQFKQVCK